MQQLIKAESKEPSPEIDTGRLQETITHLWGMLQEYNTDAADYLDGHEQLFLHSGLVPEFKKTVKALEKYDFTKAVAVVEKIADTLNIQLS